MRAFHDVVVLGGGPAGLATALALARRGVSVAMAGEPSRRGPGAGEILPPAVADPLARLGVWEQFQEDEHLPSAGVRVWWGSTTPWDWDYVRLPFSRGWHLDRRRFEDALAEAAIAAGARLDRDARARSIEHDAAGAWVVRTTAGALLRGRLVVLAAGRAPLLRHHTGSRRRLDRLVGVTAHYRRPAGAAPAEPRLWVEATRWGWWYTAPLPGDRLVAVFVTDADLLGDDWTWGERAAERVRGWVPVESPRVHPADTACLPRVTGKGFVAVGDAAFTADPIRGAGILTALRHALDAASAIVAHFDGSPTALSDYGAAVEREFQNYVAGLPLHYGAERRWPDAPFWARRHAWSGRAA